MEASRRLARDRPVELGLRANWRQFTLLVTVNAFVGAMVGLERTVVPLLAEQEFGLVSRSAALSFLITFGAVKAATNLFGGVLADRTSRKRVLLLGWLAGVPVPFLIIYAPAWSWIGLANVLLGINQGLAWSTTVIMKIDLVGPRRRGLAMGLNEFAGYLAVAASAYATGVIAERFGLRPEPFYLGIAIAALGTAISLLFVRDTTIYARAESERSDAMSGKAATLPLRDVLVRATWRDPTLMSCSQAGLVNNLNDALAWGMFPLFFSSQGLTLQQITVLAAAYPAVWGLLQLGTGALSDYWNRKWLIASGMAVQGLALLAVAQIEGFGPMVAAVIMLGAGTAMVYPTLLAAVGDAAPVPWRGSAVGAYRFWRDSGYAIGAVVAGALADAFTAAASIAAVGALTVVSGAMVAWRMPEPRRSTPPTGPPSTPPNRESRESHTR